MKKIFIALFFVMLVAAIPISLAGQGKGPAPRAELPNPAVGLITAVSEETISLRTSEGTEVAFVNRQDVPAEHLEEHRTQSWPVSITWYAEGEGKIATRIDDAE